MSQTWSFRTRRRQLPEAVDDYVDADNPVRFIDAFVDGLDRATRLLHGGPMNTRGLPFERWDCAAWSKSPPITLLANCKVRAERVVPSCSGGLAGTAHFSTFVLMEVETLGTARSLGWKVHMRCADGHREGTKSTRRCVYRRQLDLDTLVCTRGPSFPLSRLESRLMCPACGSRDVTVLFEPPTNREVRAAMIY